MIRAHVKSLLSAPWIIAIASLVPSGPLLAQNRTRTEVPFPDLPGFVTLRCDFHTHTAFSDGELWPAARAEEAWQTGLDAIALTDHIEYLPHKNDLPANYGRAYEIARAEAERLGVAAIRGAEITRGEPPGHMVALFLTNVAALNQEDYRVATRNAFEQGAFLFWAHPGWKQPEQKSVWYDEQGEFLTNGWLHGIEIVNGTDYDPIAHQWCLDKKLAMVGNSDAHDPTAWDYSGAAGDIRPMTLVFARDRTVGAIREALFARRTAVFSGNRLIGERQFVEPLFQGSIEIAGPEIRIRGKGGAVVQIRNKSPLNLELRLAPKLPELDVQDRIILPAGKVSLLKVRCLSDRVTGEQEVFLPCKVLNVLVAPNRGLSTALRLRVKYDPAK
jgi:predicted metal-dependent phosphoesterase TrpH